MESDGLIRDVRKILGIFDPLPPPHLHFTQPISTLRPQNLSILEPSPLRADVICIWFQKTNIAMDMADDCHRGQFLPLAC